MDSTRTALGATLLQFEYFLAAVEHRSLSAAAEAHYIAQPSLSEQVRRLERHLGVTLFHRTNRELLLTEAGRTLVPHARHAVDTARLAVASVAPVRDLTGGTVTFGTFSSARHLIHTPLIERFRALHPGVGVKLVGTNSVRIAEEVRSGRIECAVVALPVDDRGLEIRTIDWKPETIFLSADPGRVQRPATIADLAVARLVMPETLWGDTDPTRLRLLLAAQQANLQISPELEVESPSSALELSRRGVADTISTYAVAHALGALEEIHWCRLEPAMFEDFGFIKRKNAELTPAAQVIMRIAEDLLRELPTTGPPTTGPRPVS